MTAHLRSKGHLLTPALKEIRWTRAEHLLQWHDENRHKNILFTDEKFFTITKQYNNQNNKIYALLKCPLRCILRVQGCHHPSYIMLRCKVSHQGVTHIHFCKKGVKLVSECIKRMCYKEFWNSLTWPSSVVRNGSSVACLSLCIASLITLTAKVCRCGTVGCLDTVMSSFHPQR